MIRKNKEMKVDIQLSHLVGQEYDHTPNLMQITNA